MEIWIRVFVFVLFKSEKQQGIIVFATKEQGSKWKEVDQLFFIVSPSEISNIKNIYTYAHTILIFKFFN